MKKTFSNQFVAREDWAREQKLINEKALKKAEDEEFEAEEREKARYIARHSQNVPLMTREVSNKFKETLVLWFVFSCALSALIKILYTDVDDKTISYLCGGTYGLLVISTICSLKRIQRACIYNAAQEIDCLNFSESDRREIDILKSWEHKLCTNYPAFHKEPGGSWSWLDRKEMESRLRRQYHSLITTAKQIYENYAAAKPNSTYRILWEKEFASDSIHFECFMTLASMGMLQDFTEYKKFTEYNVRVAKVAIIENHLKTHPDDIKRVLDVFDRNSFPAGMLSQYKKTR